MQFHERLAEMRKKFSISQEQLAELIGISRQAVQKWESGLSTPDIHNLILLSKYFDVPVDFLVKGTDMRTTEELRLDKKVSKGYDPVHAWEMYSSHLKTEYIQCLEEGKDVEPLKALMDAVGGLDSGEYRESLSDIIFNMVLGLPQREEYPYIEPSGLSEIFKLRPEKAPKIKTPDNIKNLKGKLLGAWTGRACGCLLGKPIEGIRTKDLDYVLKQTGNYPLHRYINLSDLTEDIYRNCSYNLRGRCFADTVSEMPADDDTNYTVLAASKLLEQYGRSFTPDDVANVWVDSQPKSAYFTAEKVAFKNIVNGFVPPNTAIYKNPFREWIGAQIRADYFGYINPGNPQAAAEMAWRDASISHVKNGIYGEMFVAAMLACGAVCSDIKTVILAGLSQIPRTSRLYERITEILNDYDAGLGCAECFSKIHAEYDEYSTYYWCHTIPNASIVAASLLYGGLDYGKSVCLAVQSGFDTDCNGATVGSIVGMIDGPEGIGRGWTDPVNSRIKTSILGVGTVSISELADLTMKHLPNA